MGYKLGGVNAKGDILVSDGVGNLNQLPVGADGQALIADAVSATGVKWNTPATVDVAAAIADGGGCWQLRAVRPRLWRIKHRRIISCGFVSLYFFGLGRWHVRSKSRGDMGTTRVTWLLHVRCGEFDHGYAPLYFRVEAGRMMKYRNAKHTATGAIDAEILHPTLGWIPTTIEAGDNGADYDVAALHGAIVTSGTAAAFVPPTATEISTTEAAQVRSDRAGRIAEPDWTQLPDAPLTAAQKSAWSTYRQALRDVTKQATFPSNITWPVTP